MKKPKFVTGEIYHIYNRGADKRSLFSNDSDCSRFTFSMYKFNKIERTRCRENKKSRGSASAFLVDILYESLVKNHFHITLKQVIDGGIEKFMQKLGTGYAMYFNKKHDRKGVLFEGSFKAIHIDSDSYLKEISRYIHLNPLKLIEPKFREEGVRDLDRAKEFLRNYKWSSFQDYIGKKNFPYLLNNKFHSDYFEDFKEYEEFVFKGIKTA